MGFNKVGVTITNVGFAVGVGVGIGVGVIFGNTIGLTIMVGWNEMIGRWNDGSIVAVGVAVVNPPGGATVAVSVGVAVPLDCEDDDPSADGVTGVVVVPGSVDAFAASVGSGPALGSAGGVVAELSVDDAAACSVALAAGVAVGP